jgi:predicted membrane protein
VKRSRLKPLVWPVSLLTVGAAASGLAEFAVGRWQDYQLYSISRPVADLLLIIGAVWLVVAVIRVVPAAAERQTGRAPRLTTVRMATLEETRVTPGMRVSSREWTRSRSSTSRTTSRSR